MLPRWRDHQRVQHCFIFICWLREPLQACSSKIGRPDRLSPTRCGQRTIILQLTACYTASSERQRSSHEIILSEPPWTVGSCICNRMQCKFPVFLSVYVRLWSASQQPDALQLCTGCQAACTKLYRCGARPAAFSFCMTGHDGTGDRLPSRVRFSAVRHFATSHATPLDGTGPG